MIIYTNQKSKKKKVKKAQVEQYETWLKSVNSMTTSFSSNKSKNTLSRKPLTQRIPIQRSTKHIPSLQTTECDTSAKETKVYTGDKMIGIGTLHKSNAVPIFRKEDAKDQANMRR